MSDPFNKQPENRATELPQSSTGHDIPAETMLRMITGESAADGQSKEVALRELPSELQDWWDSLKRNPQEPPLIYDKHVVNRAKNLSIFTSAVIDAGFPDAVQVRESVAEITGFIELRKPSENGENKDGAEDDLVLPPEDQVTVLMELVKIAHKLGNEKEAVDILERARGRVLRMVFDDQAGESVYAYNMGDISGRIRAANVIIDTALAVGKYDIALATAQTEFYGYARFGGQTRQQLHDRQDWTVFQMLKIAGAMRQAGDIANTKAVLALLIGNQGENYLYKPGVDEHRRMQVAELSLAVGDIDTAIQISGRESKELWIAMIKNDPPYVDEAFALIDQSHFGNSEFNFRDVAKALLEVGQSGRAMAEIHKRCPGVVKEITLIKEILDTFFRDITEYSKTTGLDLEDAASLSKKQIKVDIVKEAAASLLVQVDERINQEGDPLIQAALRFVLIPEYRVFVSSERATQVLEESFPVLDTGYDSLDSKLKNQIAVRLFKETIALDLTVEDNRVKVSQVAKVLHKWGSPNAVILYRRLHGVPTEKDRD